RMLQVALGAIACGLIALLAAGVFGARAGWIAGLGAALYAPFVFYDAELLRGTVVIATQLWLLLALARRSAVWSGGALGVAYLADRSIVVFAPAAAVWLWWAGGGEAEKVGKLAVRWRAVARCAAGASIALLPLVARNLAVGAPPLSCSTRGPLAFVMGNAPD